MQKAFLIGLILLILAVSGCTQQNQNVINNALDENTDNGNTQANLCGNAKIDARENCTNCAKDAKCAEGEKCASGKCEKIIVQNSDAKIGEEFELAQGNTANIEEKNLSIKFIGILVIDGEDGIIQKARIEVKDTATKTIDLESGSSEEVAGNALKLNELNTETKIIKLILQSKETFCGNSLQESWETCSSCTADVICSVTQECVLGVCENKCKFACCSVADCDDDNNSTTDKCLNADTNSARCENTSTIPTNTGNYITMTVGSTEKNYYGGDTFNVIGKGNYAGESLQIRFDGVVQLGEGQPLKAKFSLKQDGATINSATIEQDTELQFYDDLEAEILETYVFVTTIIRTIS
ncbi:MAG: hypothetical protein Q7S21_03030 [archaeon]|nr:hypothetical protein [archaeon]